MCKDWSAPQVPELRGNSQAVTGFIAPVSKQAGDPVKGKAALVRIKAAHMRTVGRGSTVDFEIELARRDRWSNLASFDAHRDAPPPAPAPLEDGADAWA